MNSLRCRIKHLPFRASHSKGFTLIELMVVIAIAGILVSLAAPSFTNLTKNSRMRSEANALIGRILDLSDEISSSTNSVTE